MTDATAPGARILVVDDNDDNRYTLTLYLELEGYTDIVRSPRTASRRSRGWTRKTSTSSCSTS